MGVDPHTSLSQKKVDLNRTQPIKSDTSVTEGMSIEEKVKYFDQQIIKIFVKMTKSTSLIDY